MKNALFLTAILVGATALIRPAGAEESSPSLKLSGMVDVYYGRNFNNFTQVNQTNPLRNFDVYSNQLAVNLVELSLQKSAGEVGLRVDFDFGDMTDMIHPGDTVSKNFGQVILSYSPRSLPGLTLNVGKMATHLGLEVLKARDNWNYSRSLLFVLALPYWHSGVNASYAIIPEMLSAGLYVYNGWNNFHENNANKALGAQISFTPIKGVTAYYNMITGEEPAGGIQNGKTVHEANLSYAMLPDKLSFATDLALGKATAPGLDAKWTAWSIAAKYTVSPTLYLSPRFEIYSDPTSYNSLDANRGTSATRLNEITLTGGVTLSDQLQTRLEYRQDTANTEFFEKSGQPSKSQSSGLVSLIYSF